MIKKIEQIKLITAVLDIKGYLDITMSGGSGTSKLLEEYSGEKWLQYFEASSILLRSYDKTIDNLYVN